MPVVIMGIMGCQHIADGRGRAVVQVRRRAPGFDKGRRVEAVGGPVERAGGTDNVGVQIREQAWRMAAGAAYAGVGEELLAAQCR